MSTPSAAQRQAYFLVAVSNRCNLDLCVRHALAGFSNSGTGVWAYVDIQEGDYISFLYAARALNLYKVVRKVSCLSRNWNFLSRALA